MRKKLAGKVYLEKLAGEINLKKPWMMLVDDATLQKLANKMAGEIVPEKLAWEVGKSKTLAHFRDSPPTAANFEDFDRAAPFQGMCRRLVICVCALASKCSYGLGLRHPTWISCLRTSSQAAGACPEVTQLQNPTRRTAASHSAFVRSVQTNKYLTTALHYAAQRGHALALD